LELEQSRVLVYKWAVRRLPVQSVESQNSFNSLRAVNFLKAKPSADRRMPSDEAEFWPNFGRRRFLRFELGGVVCRPNIVQVGSTQKGPKHKQCVLKLATVLVDLKAVDVGDGSPIEVDTKASPSGRVKTPKGIHARACVEGVVLVLRRVAVGVDTANCVWLLRLQVEQTRVHRQHVEQQSKPNVAVEWRWPTACLADEFHVGCNGLMLNASRCCHWVRFSVGGGVIRQT
jgi:hypothetical protein